TGGVGAKDEDGHGGAVPLPRLAQTCCLAFARVVGPLICLGACDLELAGGWGLLFLVLTAMRLVPLLLSFALLWGQKSFHLFAGVAMDRLDLRLFLIGAE